MIVIRPAALADHDAIWAILEPTIRAGDTLAQPPNMDREQALEYWLATGNLAFVAEEEGAIIGSYYLRSNQRGGGSHVCNCGYVTAPGASGRGVGRVMCEHSIERGKSLGFRAMQFNFVVSTNERAIHLWQNLRFEMVGRLPLAFLHPGLGYVDALIMYRLL
jgi:L-amino acid N-acyltransferase YncA